MMFSMPNHWQEELRLFLGIMLAAGLAGTLTGQLLPCLMLGLLVYLGWHLYQLARLPHLLGDEGQDGPYSRGLWKGIAREIQGLHLSNHTRSRDLSSQLGRFRDTVNTLPDAVVILDPSGRVDWSNPAAGNLLNIVWPDSQGDLLTALVPDPVLGEYLANGDFAMPLVITSPANRAKILSVFITQLKHEADRLMLVARDITRQYYLDTARRDFVANVSHELRTPLTVISGLAEQLNTDKPDPAILSRSTELIVQQARRMSELVSDLLTLSRLEIQQKSTSDEHVPIAELLTTIIEEARTLSGAAQHVLHLDIRSPGGLHGNAKELRTAFSNLVNNAIRHTPNQAEVSVRWQVDHAGARLSVTDTGEGIAPRHIPRLTERLYRVDASHSRDTGGTGLGLAIVKHVLERHEAELEIISTVGGGSTFTCHFPPERVIL
ncbi:MAG: phosphate regulon sensor histidine kinase PhoR [Pseudomonadota bacterium]